MPIFAESQDKIFGDIISDITNNTNITRTSPGSKMRSFVEAVKRKLGRMWSQFDLNLTQAFLDGAEGQYLEFIGDMVGVQRLGEQPAELSTADRIIKFYVETGTFGDINGSQSISIPSGTIISTAANGQGVKYRTTVNTILSASNSESYVAAQSLRAGTIANVGRNKLVYHDFADYSDSNNDSLKVTNEAEIAVARNTENETNYRFRISNQIVALERANELAIRLSALSVPGVADIVMLPYYRGIGTYDILIKSTTPVISTNLINAVDEAITNVSSQGINPKARGPVEIGTSLTATLTLKRKVSASEEQSIIDGVTNNITDYINNLDIGEDLVINEIIERIMSTSDVIKTVGSANNPLDSIFIYTPSKLEDNKIRSRLLDDLSPKSDERIIVETQYAGNTPILIRTTV